jgi:hypothetical protein
VLLTAERRAVVAQAAASRAAERQRRAPEIDSLPAPSLAGRVSPIKGLSTREPLPVSPVSGAARGASAPWRQSPAKAKPLAPIVRVAREPGVRLRLVQPKGEQNPTSVYQVAPDSHSAVGCFAGKPLIPLPFPLQVAPDYHIGRQGAVEQWRHSSGAGHGRADRPSRGLQNCSAAMEKAVRQ